MYKVTAKFPDINRELDLVCTPGSMYFGKMVATINDGSGARSATEAEIQMAAPYLGCHCTWLSQLYLQPENTYAPAIRVLDPSKEPDGVSLYATQPTNYYQKGDVKTLASGEKTKVQAALRSYVVPDSEREPIFADLITRFSTQHEGTNHPNGPTFVIMADNVNSYADEFPKCSGIPNVWAAPGFKISDFVDYIVKTKSGFLMASPIGRNQYHQSTENFSLTQAYIWVPPNHVKFLAPSSWYLRGRENMPDWPTWYADTLKKLPRQKTPEDIDEHLFKERRPKIRHSSHRLANGGSTATVKSLFGKKGN